MISFFISGGAVMFVLLAIGVPLIVAAAKFARSAGPQRLALIRALTVALAFATLSGVTSDLMTAAKAIANTPEWLKEPLPVVLEGFGESMAPAVFAGVIASIAWILVAFGVRRMPRE